MTRLDYRTAGESHGRSVWALVEGMPAGVPIDVTRIDGELKRRQGGFGRGARMRIEQDAVCLQSGVRNGVSIGSPIAMSIENKDWRIDTAPPVHRPRPGHADLAGSIKWLTTDCRETLERASARETAARVAAGALTRCLLDQFSIHVVGYVRSIGGIEAGQPLGDSLDEIRQARDESEVYCSDPDASKRMVEAIKAAKKNKDTLGGMVEVQVRGHPPGLGSCMRWQDKLDGRLMQAVGSVQAIKAVEIGLGVGVTARPGSEVHDPIEFHRDEVASAGLGFVRRTNNAGGIEGGMTNGAPIIIRAAMKPISTLLQGLDSVNLVTKKAERSDYERSDICAVPAASVVVENVVAFEIARAFVEKFGGDTLQEVRAAYDSFLSTARSLGENG